MNLLLVNSAAPELWGGGEKWFVEAAAWFAKHDHAVTLVARPESLLMKRASERGVAVIPSRFGGDYDPLAMLRASNVLRVTRTDVVLTNFNKEAWHFGVAAKFTRAHIVARHGFPLWNDKRHHRFLAKRLLSHVVVNAESILDHYRTLHIDLSRVSVIYNGVAEVAQMQGALRAELGCAPDDLLLVAAGRLESQKRFDRLLRITADISKSRSIKVAIFGQGPHERELREHAQALKLGGVVHFMGFRENFAAVVGDADVFLLTSDNEGSPNVVLEAMAAGVPVLGFSVGNMQNVLHGELSDFLVAAEEEAAFTTRLRELLAAPARLRDMRSRFQKRILDEFSFDKSMRRYEELLTGLAARR